MSRFPSSVRFEYDEAHSTNFTRGNWRKDFIVIHHWDDPAKRPQFDGVVSWFKNPSANVSIQYMVEANRITQMIPESAMAWHAGHSTANRHGIGLELNPRQSAGDYETAAVLVAEIWTRLGRKLPLRRHREFFGTACPGTYDVARIRRRAEQIYSGSSSTPAPTPTPAPKKDWFDMATKKELEDVIRSVVPRAVWAYMNENVDSRQAFNMLRNVESDILYNRDFDYVNSDNPTSVRHQIAKAHEESRAGRRMDDRRMDYVNESPTSARHQIAKSHQYSRDARRDAREANAKADALADAVAELVGEIDQNTRKALEDKLAAIKTESARIEAADVAAELEVTVREDDEEEG